MRNFMICRRTFLGTLAIVCLTGLGVYQGTDVSYAIAGLVSAIGAANAYEKKTPAQYSSKG